MKNFKKLHIWQKGMEISVNCFQIVKSFPIEERFGLSSQITRAAVSIPSNIAEGRSRTSSKQYCYFIEISLGSSFELETQLLIAQRVGYGDSELVTSTLLKIDEEQKMLIRFLLRLRDL